MPLIGLRSGWCARGPVGNLSRSKNREEAPGPVFLLSFRSMIDARERFHRVHPTVENQAHVARRASVALLSSGEVIYPPIMGLHTEHTEDTDGALDQSTRSKRPKIFRLALKVALAGCLVDIFLLSYLGMSGYRVGSYIGSWRLLLLALGVFLIVPLAWILLSALLRWFGGSDWPHALENGVRPFLASLVLLAYLPQLFFSIPYLGRWAMAAAALTFVLLTLLELRRIPAFSRMLRPVISAAGMVAVILLLGFLVSGRVWRHSEPGPLKTSQEPAKWDDSSVVSGAMPTWVDSQGSPLVAHRLSHGGISRPVVRIPSSGIELTPTFQGSVGFLDLRISLLPEYDGTWLFTLTVDEQQSSATERVSCSSGSWCDARIVLDGKPVDFDQVTVHIAPHPSGKAQKGQTVFLSLPEISVHRQADDLNVLLISLDTLRADHLGTYGYQRSTSPEIDTLSGESTVFLQAIASAPWTGPSHMSMLTGLLPSEHGIVGVKAEALSKRLSIEHGTLAEVLKRAGFATAAFTGGGYVSPEVGFGRGFDRYDVIRTTRNHRSVDLQVGAAIDWISDHRRDRFFVFLHTFEVHAPHNHGAFVRHRDGYGSDLKQQTIDAYDSGISYTDQSIGKLVDALERMDLLDDTLVVLTSDHGEEFGGHFPWLERIGSHTIAMCNHVLHVPLIVRHPRFLPLEGERRIPQYVSLVDLPATLLECLGEPITLPGTSFAEALQRGEWPEGRTPTAVFAESGSHFPPERKAVIFDGWKYVRVTDTAREGWLGSPAHLAEEQLFDLRNDPGERHNLVEENPPALERARELILDLLAGLPEHQPAEIGAEPQIDEEQEEQLRALGYVD